MFLVKPVLAQCPVCIVTVGGGMFLAQKLGIDDLLIAIWISAFNTAVAYWLAPKFKIKLLSYPLILSFLFYVFTLIYFAATDQLGMALDLPFGIHKTTLGLTLGFFSVALAAYIDRYIRYKNKGKVLFYYQKVIIPVFILLAATFASKLVFNL